MKIGTREIGSAAAGVTTLGAGIAGLPFTLLGDLAIAGPMALIVGGSCLFFWPSAQTVKREQALDSLIAEASKQAGIDPKEVVEAISTANIKLDKIRTHAKDIRAPNTSRRIAKICQIGDKIVEDFRVDPKDVRVARAWIGTYLDQTIDLVKAYATLSRTGARSIEAQKQMAKFDEMLDLIEDKFDELLKTLLENDVMDFDVNITVMRNMLTNEGIT